MATSEESDTIRLTVLSEAEIIPLRVDVVSGVVVLRTRCEVGYDPVMIDAALTVAVAGNMAW